MKKVNSILARPLYIFNALYISKDISMLFLLYFPNPSSKLASNNSHYADVLCSRSTYLKGNPKCFSRNLGILFLSPTTELSWRVLFLALAKRKLKTIPLFSASLPRFPICGWCYTHYFIFFQKLRYGLVVTSILVFTVVFLIFQFLEECQPRF